MARSIKWLLKELRTSNRGEGLKYKRFNETNPVFALEAGMAALRWLVEGFGYEITGLDVLNAYSYTIKAAERAGRAEETLKRIRDLVATHSPGVSFVTAVLGRQLGLS